MTREDPGRDRLPRAACPGWALDAGALLLFAVLALSLHVNRTRGVSPVLDLDSDAGNIASFCAAWDHPERFAGDEALGDPRNYRHYATLHIPLVRWLARRTAGYGDAFLLLLGPTLFLLQLGFYCLGRSLFASRFWAAVLALAMLPHYPLGLGTGWGHFPEPTPRLLFAALVGFLMAAAVRWRGRPAAWPWIMAGAGLGMYVHAVGAPVIGLALWMGLAASRPAHWSWKRHAATLLGLGLLFLAVGGLFIANYLTSHEHGPAADYDRVYAAMTYRFAPGFLDIPYALRLAFEQTKRMLLPMGALGALALLASRRSRPVAGLLLAWLAGVLVASVLVPWVEQSVARRLRAIPTQIDLIRGVRFLAPLCILLWLTATVELERSLPGAAGPRAGQLGLVGLCFLLFIHADAAILVEAPRAALAHWRGRLPPDRKKAAHSAAVIAVRDHTRPGERVLSLGVNSLAIRYAALRPVVYAFKDGGILAYANHPRLLEWKEKESELRRIMGQPWEARKADDLVAWARALGASWLAIACERPERELLAGRATLVWSSERYALLRLAPGPAGREGGR